MPRAVKQNQNASKTAKTANKKKAKKKKIVKDEEYEEFASEAKKIQNKFSKKKGKDDEMAFIKVKGENKKISVVNCEQHSNIVSRAEEYQISKMYQIEIRSNVIPTHWKCGLCGLRSAQDDLGDLFGPYYVPIDIGCPTFLAKKTQKHHASDMVVDIWLHGDCALWAPNIQMKGSELTNLEEQLIIFWKQNCSVCHIEGASIPLGHGKFVHYPCAKKNGYKMNELIMSCEAK